MQILACLTGDTQTAALCNVISNPAGKRMDAYTALYDKLGKQAGIKLTASRDDVKRAIMTSFYTSEAEPRRVFGEGEVLEHFYQTLRTNCPGAWELNEAFMSFWNPNAEHHIWTLPDGFLVKVKVVGKTTEAVFFDDERFEVPIKVVGPQPTGRSLGANIVHSLDGMIVREMVRRCDYNPGTLLSVVLAFEGTSYDDNRSEVQKKYNKRMVKKLWTSYADSGFLSARILNYIDRDTVGMVDKQVIWDLINRLPAKPFEILTVHDCFRCLPNYCNDLRQQYIYLLSDLAKSEMLNYILSQLAGKYVGIKKINPDLYLEILNTEYPLS